MLSRDDIAAAAGNDVARLPDRAALTKLAELAQSVSGGARRDYR
jgi:hypothetical protein